MTPFILARALVLAIAPTSRGFGFAVLEGGGTLVDWGAKAAKGDKNAACLAHVEALLAHYKPDVIVIETYTTEDCRRSRRVRVLLGRIAVLASSHRIRVRSFSRMQIRRAFSPHDGLTKHAIASAVAEHFPKKLGFRLPPRRRPWMSEDYRMCIFEAVALALTLFLHRMARQRRMVV